MHSSTQAMMLFRLAMALTALVQAALAFSTLAAVVLDVPVDGMYLRTAAGCMAVLGGVGAALWLAEHRLALRRTPVDRRDFGGQTPGAV